MEFKFKLVAGQRATADRVQVILCAASQGSHVPRKVSCSAPCVHAIEVALLLALDPHGSVVSSS